MPAHSDADVTAVDQVSKEILHFLTVSDSGERAVIAAEADAGMQHDGDEKARLAFGVPVLRHGAPAFFPGHRKNSSASPGSYEEPRRPLDLPPTRPPVARYRVKPARAFPAACAPR